MTFLLYTVLVFFVIIVSLSVKAIFIIQKNKFDGNNLNLAISQNDNIVDILGFNSIKKSISILKIEKSKLDEASVGQELGIIPDAKIESNIDISGESTVSILKRAALMDSSIKTNLTIFDIVQLIILTKSASGKDIQVNEITLPVQDYQIDKINSNLFKNDTLISENVSIQVINATGKPGLGQRLGRILTNIGANVVSISTSNTTQHQSKIQYFGSTSYTVEKLKKLLDYPVERVDKETIANITIIIGENNKTL